MIEKTKLKDLLIELRQGLEIIYGMRLRGLYLYGSYARREQDDESDVDVLVVLNDFESYYAEVHRTGQLASDLSLKYSVTISEVFMKEEKWLYGDTPFLMNVRPEAIAA